MKYMLINYLDKKNNYDIYMVSNIDYDDDDDDDDDRWCINVLNIKYKRS